jgi:hypothetical protein
VQPAPTPTEPAFVFTQNTDAWVCTGTVLIGTADITIQENSRILIQARSSGIGSVDAGFAFIHTDVAVFPELASIVGQEAYTAATGSNRRSLWFYAFTDPKPAGLYTVDITVDVNGNAGSRFDGVGITLSLTEIPE